MSIPDIFDRYLAEESQIELDVPAQDRARFHLVVRDCALSWKRHPKATFHILRGKHLFALQFQGPVEGKSVTLFTFRSAVETGEYRFHGIQLDKLPSGITPQARSNLERIKELYEAALPGHMQNEGAIVVPVKKSPSIDFLPIVDEARRVVDDGQQEFEPVDENARMIIPAERAGDLVFKQSPSPEPKVKVVKPAVEPAKPAPVVEKPKAVGDEKPAAKSKKSKSQRSVPTNASMDDLILNRPLDPRSTVVFDSNNWPKVVAPTASKSAAKSAAKAPAKSASTTEAAKALPMSRLPQSANPTPQKVVDLSKWMNRPIKLVQSDEKPVPKPATKAGKAPPRPPTVPAPKHGHAAKAAAAAAAAADPKNAAKVVIATPAAKTATPMKPVMAAKAPAPAKAVVTAKPTTPAKAAPAPKAGAKPVVATKAAVAAKPTAAAKPAVVAKPATKAAAKPAPKKAATPVKSAAKPVASKKPAPKPAAKAAPKPAAKAMAKKPAAPAKKKR